MNDLVEPRVQLHARSAAPLELRLEQGIKRIVILSRVLKVLGGDEDRSSSAA